MLALCGCLAAAFAAVFKDCLQMIVPQPRCDGLFTRSRTYD